MGCGVCGVKNNFLATPHPSAKLKWPLNRATAARPTPPPPLCSSGLRQARGGHFFNAASERLPWYTRSQGPRKSNTQIVHQLLRRQIRGPGLFVPRKFGTKFSPEIQIFRNIPTIIIFANDWFSDNFWVLPTAYIFIALRFGNARTTENSEFSSEASERQFFAICNRKIFPSPNKGVFRYLLKGKT